VHHGENLKNGQILATKKNKNSKVKTRGFQPQTSKKRVLNTEVV
jgi:hypothetical protein